MQVRICLRKICSEVFFFILLVNRVWGVAGYMSLDVVHKQNHGMKKFFRKNLLPGCTLVASLLHSCMTMVELQLSSSKAVKHSVIM